MCRGWAEPWTAGDMPGSPNHRTVHFEGCAVALLGDMDPERLRMVARTEVRGGGGGGGGGVVVCG